jgi:NDP-sugar pyrophosphorylase family protein
VLIWNADILTEAPVEQLLTIAAERDAQVLAVSPRARGEGSVGLDADGGVVRLRGKVFGEEKSGGDYIGVMALGPGVLAALPERGCLAGDVALPSLAAGRRVWTVPSPGPWNDLGDLAAYVEANFEWLARTGRAVWQAPNASLAAGVALEQSLLGAGARVTGQGTLRRVIAWPGAPVVAPLEQAVVLTSGRVVPFDVGAEN